MSTLHSAIESLLLVTPKPLSFEVLAKLTKASKKDVEQAVDELTKKFSGTESGIQILVNNERVQFATNPRHKELIAEFIKDETTGELTKPSLETLTIIAYRQPITKEELEHIRGVNCSLILRNLLIRGLIETHEARGGLAITYVVTMDFLRFLGITSVQDLPNYKELNSHESLQALLNAAQADAASQIADLHE